MGFQVFKKINALQVFEQSDLKKVVDAVAEISEASIDESGSFAVLSKEQGTEKYSVVFNRHAGSETHAPGIAFDFAAENQEEIPFEDGGSYTIGRTQSKNYSVHGQNVGFFLNKMPKFVPFIGGKSLETSPDDIAAEFLAAAQLAAPILYKQILEKTGLPALPEIKPGEFRLF